MAAVEVASTSLDAVGKAFDLLERMTKTVQRIKDKREKVSEARSLVNGTATLLFRARKEMARADLLRKRLAYAIAEFNSAPAGAAAGAHHEHKHVSSLTNESSAQIAYTVNALAHEKWLGAGIVHLVEEIADVFKLFNDEQDEQKLEDLLADALVKMLGNLKAKDKHQTHFSQFVKAEGELEHVEDALRELGAIITSTYQAIENGELPKLIDVAHGSPFIALEAVKKAKKANNAGAKAQ